MGAGSSQTTTQNTGQTPWEPQANELMSMFGQANNIYGAEAGTPYYQDQLYAPITEQQSNAYNALNSNATAAAAQGLGLVNTGIGAIPGAISGASGILNGLSNGVSGDVNPLISASNNVGNGINWMTAGVNGINGLAADPTGANIAAAGQYANNPALNGQIQAAMTDINRNLTQDTLPTLNAQAIAGGNLNSSRAGAASAIATSQAQENMANLEAQMRGNAYSQGLNLAESGRVANMNADQAMAALGNQAINSGINGATNANNFALGNGQLQTAAANGLLNTGNLGLNTASGGFNLLNNGFGAAAQAGAGFQQDAQAQDQANYQRWQGNLQQPWNLLNAFDNIVGSKLYGSSGTESATTQSSGNKLGSALALAAGAASMIMSGGATAPLVMGGLTAMGGAAGLFGGGGSSSPGGMIFSPSGSGAVDYGGTGSSSFNVGAGGFGGSGGGYGSLSSLSPASFGGSGVTWGG